MSRIVRIPDVIAALSTWIAQLDGVHPLRGTNIPATNIFAASAPPASTVEDKDFPKLMIVLDGGTEEDKAARRTFEKVSFDLVFIFKQIPNTIWDVAPGIQTLNLVEDFKDLRRADDTLGGTIQSMRIVEWTTDSGFADPEGMVWMKIECQWDNMI